MEHKTLMFSTSYFASSLAALQTASEDGVFQSKIVDTANAIVRALQGGGKVMFIGNGGSAGDAQHIAGEFVSRLNFDRAPLAGIALTTDTSALTAIGNDYGYENVFARQVAGLGSTGDILVAITTSGNSPSILKAIDIAKEKGIIVVCMTGRLGGATAGRCDINLNVPSDSTSLIQQVYMVAAHAICGIVEAILFKEEAGGARN